MKTPIFDPPTEGDILDATSDPVESLRKARQRSMERDRGYYAILYIELAVVYAAHGALIDDPGAWAEFAKRAEEELRKAIPVEPRFPDSLRYVAEFVFSGKQSSNRAYKYARALELLYKEGVPAETVPKRLKVAGIDQLYADASSRYPRREKPKSAEAASTRYWDNVVELDDEEADQVDDDDDDANPDEHELEVDGFDRTTPPPPQPAARIHGFDPDRTLFIDCDPERLRLVLKLAANKTALLKIRSKGKDAQGWTVISAVHFKREKKPPS